MKKFLTLCTFILSSLCTLYAAGDQQVLLSPNGALKFYFSQEAINSGGTQLTYSVSYKGADIISESKLGVDV